jgi:hypothetical protein
MRVSAWRTDIHHLDFLRWDSKRRERLFAKSACDRHLSAIACRANRHAWARSAINRIRRTVPYICAAPNIFEFLRAGRDVGAAREHDAQQFTTGHIERLRFTRCQPEQSEIR